MQNPIFKKDKYSRARGGSSKLLSIICSSCNNQMCTYQKDGPGGLLRMYLDRFVSPIDLIKQFQSTQTKKDIHGLQCPHCNSLVAVPMVYKKENRLAFRLIPNKIKSKELIINKKNED